MRERIKVGDLAFVSDGDRAFGAVREIGPEGRSEIVIYVENAGHFVVALDAVEDVHAGKVLVRYGRLDPDLQEAIGHAHDAEDPSA